MINSTKQHVRKWYVEKRQSLQPTEKQAFLQQMLQLFGTLPISGSFLMSYKPLEIKAEIAMTAFEANWLSKNKFGRLVFPAADFKTHAMEAVEDNAATLWEKGKFGLEQPIAGEIVPPEKIDVIFVPLLAFDESGYRLGYGKGFYDRFLMRCRNDVVKIGFSYFAPLSVLPEIGAFDIPLNYCVTPQQLYVF